VSATEAKLGVFGGLNSRPQGVEALAPHCKLQIGLEPINWASYLI